MYRQRSERDWELFTQKYERGEERWREKVDLEREKKRDRERYRKKEREI